MRKILGLALVIVCVSGLIGCNLLNPPKKQSESALDDFVYALRWQQYDAAARFMKSEHRKDFLNTFTAAKDLDIVDVRLISAELSAEGRRTETVIEMDYYMLPSTTVKTFRFEQTWIYYDRDDQNEGYYEIVTPFPPLP